jgi:hypothetical protein
MTGILILLTANRSREFFYFIREGNISGSQIIFIHKKVLYVVIKYSLFPVYHYNKLVEPLVTESKPLMK